MALKIKQQTKPSEDVFLSLKQDGRDVDLYAEVNGENILLAFFNSRGELHLCTNGDEEKEALQGHISLTDTGVLVTHD